MEVSRPSVYNVQHKLTGTYKRVQMMTSSEHIAIWLNLRCIDCKGLFQLHNTGYKHEVCRRYDCVSP